MTFSKYDMSHQFHQLFFKESTNSEVLVSFFKNNFQYISEFDLNNDILQALGRFACKDKNDPEYNRLKTILYISAKLGYFVENENIGKKFGIVSEFLSYDAVLKYIIKSASEQHNVDLIDSIYNGSFNACLKKLQIDIEFDKFHSSEEKDKIFSIDTLMSISNNEIDPNVIMAGSQYILSNLESHLYNLTTEEKIELFIKGIGSFDILYLEQLNQKLDLNLVDAFNKNNFDKIAYYLASEKSHPDFFNYVYNLYIENMGDDENPELFIKSIFERFYSYEENSNMISTIVDAVIRTFNGINLLEYLQSNKYMREKSEKEGYSSKKLNEYAKICRYNVTGTLKSLLRMDLFNDENIKSHSDFVDSFCCLVSRVPLQESFFESLDFSKINILNKDKQIQSFINTVSDYICTNFSQDELKILIMKDIPTFKNELTDIKVMEILDFFTNKVGKAIIKHNLDKMRINGVSKKTDFKI